MFVARYVLLTLISISFVLFGFITDSPSGIIAGLYRIMVESGVLITDYIAVGGMGAAFVNAGLLMLVSLLIMFVFKVDITGVTIAAVFLMGSFGLFGKNLLNIWPILLGVYLYSRLRREPFRNLIHVALLATSIAPIVTELLFFMGLPLWLGIILSMAVGVSIGLIITPLSANVLKIHNGFNLYNIGFSVGILGTVYVSVFKSYGYATYSKLVWSTGNDFSSGVFLVSLFIAFAAVGILINRKAIKRLGSLFAFTGNPGSDFYEKEDFATLLVNMGINGLLALGYVLLVGGNLNGPTIGGILTVSGFGAFGKHARNILPIFLGVYIGSVTKMWNVNDPSILLAALFGTALAPIAGHYGWFWGVVAGFINSSVVLNSGILHGGMNLYNTGFSAGIVAAVMVPLLNAFRKKEPEN